MGNIYSKCSDVKKLLLIILVILGLTITFYYLESLIFRGTPMKPSLSIIRVSSQKVPLYGLLELDLNVTGNFKNPFNPDEVEVSALIETPKGETIEVPAFYYQEFKRELVEGRETLTPMGEPYWKIRFTPMEAGTYKLHVLLRTASHTVTSEELTFDVYESDRGGFVRVSEVDKRYFKVENGESLFFIGHNVCWFGSRGTFDYDEWFSAMNKSGENITRIWMAPWAFGIEWKKLGYYDLAEAWRLDYVIKKAEEEGIYIILCLMNHGQLQSGGLTGQWNDNPYNAKNGGPLSKPEDFWTDENAIRLFKKRLRYIVARWGYSTHVLAWELWNEVELTDNYDFDVVAKWHEEMAKYIRGIDPYRHLITTSSDPRLGGLNGIDFVTVHKYGPQSFKDIAGVIPEIVENLWISYGKPILITEFGADWRWFDNPYYYKDTEGVELHNGIWSSVLSGSASTSMLWWWDNYIHPYNLYGHFKALSNYLKGVNPEESRFVKIQAKVLIPSPLKREDLTEITIYPSLGWVKPEVNVFKIEVDGKVANISQLSSFIHGKAHPELKNNPTFIVSLPYGGEAVIHVNSVSRSGATLDVYIDNLLVESRVFKDIDGKNDAEAEEYNLDVKVAVPPGVHELRFDNSGGDWLTFDYIKFTNAVAKQSKVRVIGLKNDTMSLLWIQNRDHTWWNVVNNIPIEPVEKVEIELCDFKDGGYIVEYWDTYTGVVVKIEETVAVNGEIHLTIEDLEKDVALKIYRKTF
jgi:hypothetical protein